MLILAKIRSRNAKVDSPLIFFDLHACYNEPSFERDSKILVQKKTWDSHLSQFSLVFDLYIALKSNSKMGLSVILKGQPI